MATKKKKIVEEVEQTIEAPKEILQEPVQSEEAEEYKPNFDFKYEVKVDATVEKAVKEVEVIAETLPIKEEKLYTVKRVEGINIFAIDKNGKYIMLKKQGKYANIKFGDTIIL